MTYHIEATPAGMFSYGQEIRLCESWPEALGTAQEMARKHGDVSTTYWAVEREPIQDGSAAKPAVQAIGYTARFDGSITQRTAKI